MRARRRHGSPVNAWIVRPLLHLQRAQLEEWAKTRRLRHCHDGSNDDLRLLRNRVRHELMPLLKSRFCPGTDSNIRRTMRGLADDADFLRTAAQTWLAASGKMPFGRLHPALQRQIIVRQLERLKAEFDWQAVEQLRTTEEDWANLPGGKQIARSADGRLRVRPQPPERTVKSIKPVELNLQAPSGRVQFAGVEFRWQIAAAGRTPRFGAGREYFDADRVGETITLRSWRPGDRFQPIGLSRSAKLQDLFTNARIQRERRQSLVVGENSVGEIFWVEGLRLAEGFKLTAATRRVLHWQWRRIGRKPAARTGAK
ncbi:MAG TPA: hypothetical protein DCY13_16590, partial [Verrucomicrobiales bacterium]|nr:hypothetical protein [Verrucomicrobiales bacterium]